MRSEQIPEAQGASSRLRYLAAVRSMLLCVAGRPAWRQAGQGPQGKRSEETFSSTALGGR